MLLYLSQATTFSLPTHDNHRLTEIGCGILLVEAKMLNIGIYRQCLQEIVQEAIAHSDGSNAGIAEYLRSVKVGGWFTRNKTEKRKALEEARKAFDEHRHWPLEIVISHLGLDLTIMRLRTKE
jgi:hypothetical protein